METEEILAAIQQAADTIATPNWATILSVIAAIFSAIAALGAIIVAIIVAQKQNEITMEQVKLSQKQADISDKQNQIALFEKKFELYTILFTCVASAGTIRLIEKNEDILECLFIMFTGKSEIFDESNSFDASIYLINRSLKLQQAAFLFSEEVVPYIVNISFALFALASANVETDGQDKFNKIKQEYFMAIKDFEDNEGFGHILSEMNLI